MGRTPKFKLVRFNLIYPLRRRSLHLYFVLDVAWKTEPITGIEPVSSNPLSYYQSLTLNDIALVAFKGKISAAFYQLNYTGVFNKPQPLASYRSHSSHLEQFADRFWGLTS